MRVLHIINALAVGGAERLLVDMLPKMKEYGIDVELLLLNGKKTIFLSQMEHQGVRVYKLDNVLVKEYNPWNIFRLKKFMKGYDVIHVHLFPAQYWVALSYKLFGKNAVLITTEHSTYNRRAKYKITSWIDHKIYALYDCVICISEATKDFLAKYSFSGACLKVIENGVNINSFRLVGKTPQNMPFIDSNCFNLMQVARFQDAKNQDCLIRAMVLLPPNIHVIFVGDGERLMYCKQLAVNLGVASRVHFLGKRSDIPQLWQMVDVGVMSSHWEGFGLAAVEGMAAGKPVLVSRVSGLSDVVDDKRLQFEPDNEKDLANKVLSLYNSRELMAELSAYCKLRADNYDISVMTKKYIELYKTVLIKKNA